MPRSPNAQKRTVILGRTGTGKSQFAWDLMSRQNFDEMPWTIIDYKREDLIDDTVKACGGGIKDIRPTDNPPKKPGLYRMLCKPNIDDDAVEAYLWKVYNNGYHGLLVDEGYALPQSTKSPVTTILTQGRSLHIPMIILFQRPAWMNRFMIAQADFFAVFEQNDERDLKITTQFVKPAKGPNNELITVFSPLPPYYCLWYDVSEGVTSVLKPVPDRQRIINAFKSRLSPHKQKALI